MKDQLKKLTILYVEDEQDVMDEISDMLRLKVGNLYTSQNGKEALEIYKNESVDIIVTDIQMPIMDGLELTAEIRKLNSDIPIVITTAFNELEFLNKAIDLNVDKYLTKPIDIIQLIKVLKRCSRVVLQKQQIEQRDIIIQTMLKMKPHYSILVDEENLGTLNQDIFLNLGFKNNKDINIEFQISNKSCEKIDSFQCLVEKISLLKSDSKLEETIYLKEKEDLSYIVKPYFFEGTSLFMLSFFESNKLKEKNELSMCQECASVKVLQEDMKISG